MRRCSAIALLSVLVPAATPLYADEPAPAAPAAAPAKTHAVRVRERWKAGDVVTRMARESMRREVDVARDGQTSRVPVPERQTSYVVVTRCLEADAEGYVTKALLYVTSWSVEVGPQRDTSLAGIHVELAGKGAERTWKVLTPDAKPSDAAKQWIEQFYGKQASGEQTYADLEPAKAVAVGETWAGDGVAMGRRLAERGVKVDAAASKATGTLVAVEGDVARLRLHLTFPTTELALPNGPSLPWKEGGVLDLTVELSRSLATGHFVGAMKRTQRLAGIAEADGQTITWEDLGSQELEIEEGGKMPELPASPSPGPDAPK
jgi:hypothetical protein